MAKGVAAPLPDPPNAWDTAIVEGEHWQEIQELLEETVRCAQADFDFRKLKSRRAKNWARLRNLNVSVGRIRRHYAIDGTPIISHPTIIHEAEKGGYVAKEHPNETEGA